MIAIDRIVVAGASLAGLRAVQAMREAGFAGDITVIGAERHFPYDRPPLSKQILSGEWEPERLALDPIDEIEPLATWRLGVPAAALDLRGHSLLLADGERVPYDRLLIATGAAPIPFPGAGDRRGLVTLRTIEDALALREAMRAGGRLAVIGGGFIGCEVAAAGIARGMRVTILESLATPVQRVLGAEVGAAIGRLHERRGVEVRCGVRVGAIEGNPVSGVRLESGELIPADVVVVGIGARPNTGWLEGSGLALENGVTCDEFCRTSDPAVFAAGDCANWLNPLFATRMRVEHWTNAVEMGMAAAENLLAGEDGLQQFAPVPYVWSDQHGESLRFAGYAAGYEEMRIAAGSLEEGGFVALYRRGERLAAVLTFEMGRALAPYQKLIAKGGTWAEAVALAPRT